MPAAAQAEERRGPILEVKPEHVDAMRQLDLKQRLNDGTKFGESTIITATINNGRSGIFGDFGIKSTTDFLRITGLSATDPERADMDKIFWEHASEFATSFQKIRSDGITVTLAVTDEIALRVNITKAQELSVMLFAGDKCYCIDKNGSTLSEIYSARTCQFLVGEEHEKAFMEVTPPLADLIKLQDKTGEDLRNELPLLSMQFASYVKEVCSQLERLGIAKPTGLKHIESDIQDDVGGEVKLYLFPDLEGQLDRFHLIR